MATKSQTTNSGIRKLSNGESIIPASTRADGTVRREIRVKPGYRPPEDVEVYKNRTAEAWKNRGKGGVPGAESITADSAASVTANKNAKRREARRKAAVAAATDGEAPTNDTNGSVITPDGGAPTSSAQPETVDAQAEAAKEARKLAKKLRQARELKDKKDKGDSLLPEQFAKVIKIQELIRQLDGLGFDVEGEKKVQDPI